MASDFPLDEWTATINATYFENYSALKAVKSPLNVHLHIITYFIISYTLLMFQEDIKMNMTSCCTIVLNVLNVQNHL